MFEIMIAESLNPALLIILGLGLMVAEVLIVGTFVLFWAALATILVGVVSFFSPLSWQWQVGLITVLGGVFTVLLNPYVKKRRHTQDEAAFAPEQDQVAIGQLHLNKDGQWSVFYKGTYWLVDPSFDLTDKQTGEAVSVYGIKSNHVILVPEESR